MHLAAPNPERLTRLFGWFNDDRSVSHWGGPNMRLPMSLKSMQVDARMDTLASWFLLSDSRQAVGFGQYYDRTGFCHLGRLVIAPDQRGQRLGQILITELVREGTKELGLPGQSLFVRQDNPSAINLYERMGFRVAHYPESDLNMTGINYMRRSGNLP